eukprot:scaffold2898_cov68-Phaeocystis_antarctica.AAC.3
MPWVPMCVDTAHSCRPSVDTGAIITEDCEAATSGPFQMHPSPTHYAPYASYASYAITTSIENF